MCYLNENVKCKLSYIFLVLVTLSCSNKHEIITVNQDFYTLLKEQTKEDYFSPKRFSEDKEESNADVDWILGASYIGVKEKKERIQFNFDSIAVEYENGKEKKQSSYKIIIYNSDGTKSFVDKLVNPVKQNDEVCFSTVDPNINLSIKPFKDSFKWKILPKDKAKVDSLRITVKTKGSFYGGGERYIGSCLNGRTISNQPNDHYWDPPWHKNATWANKHEPGHYKKYEPTYLQIPFALNPHGEAWYVDDASSVFMTFHERGNQFDITVKNNQTEFYTIHQNTPKQALHTYTTLVGKQPKLEDWMVGVWVNLLDGKDSVYAKANRLKKWDIPASAIWVFDMYDPETSTGYQHWSTGEYGNLRELTDSLHSLDFKVLTYLHPYQEVKMPKTDIDNPEYIRLDSLGVILHNPKSILNKRYKYNTDGLYNFHKPLMGELWGEMIKKILLRDNFDGWMEDFGDLSYSFDQENKKWDAIDYGLDNPLTPNQYVNSYPLVYHKLSYLHANAINSNLATFCRSGSAGSAPYTKIVWGGDQMATWSKDFGYPSVISSGISCGLSGYANWAPDVLCNSTSIELWKRWVQFAAFTPILRDHLWVNKPSSIDLWTSNETKDYFKKYAEVHMSLVPYIQKHLEEYRKAGTPIIRHMMLEFPEDDKGYGCEYQYMFGPKYLVAPVVEEGELIKKIYFPKGKWRSFWSKKIISSKGEWVTVPAPLEELPVYEKLQVNF